MSYSCVGTNLEVNLTRGSIKKEKSTPELVRDYLGGKGLGVKILWDRVPPETMPLSPDNLIIITNGLLTGTVVPLANRCVSSFISPLTGFTTIPLWGDFGPPN